MEPIDDARDDVERRAAPLEQERHAHPQAPLLVREPLALGIIDRSRRGNTIVSAQVLNETYWCLTRRLRTPLSGTAARDVVQALADGRVVPIEPSLVLRAIDRAQHSRLAYWDALIVEAALGSSCRRLLTEDLQHGQRFDGLTVENPFRETPPP